jgi:hypothetical protein
MYKVPGTPGESNGRVMRPLQWTLWAVTSCFAGGGALEFALGVSSALDGVGWLKHSLIMTLGFMACISIPQWLVLMPSIHGLSRWIPLHLVLGPVLMLLLSVYINALLAVVLILICAMLIQYRLLHRKLRDAGPWVFVGGVTVMLGLLAALALRFLQGVPGGMY